MNKSVPSSAKQQREISDEYLSIQPLIFTSVYLLWQRSD